MQATPGQLCAALFLAEEHLEGADPQVRLEVFRQIVHQPFMQNVDVSGHPELVATLEAIHRGEGAEEQLIALRNSAFGHRVVENALGQLAQAFDQAGVDAQLEEEQDGVEEEEAEADAEEVEAEEAEAEEDAHEQQADAAQQQAAAAGAAAGTANAQAAAATNDHHTCEARGDDQQKQADWLDRAVSFAQIAAMIAETIASAKESNALVLSATPATAPQAVAVLKSAQNYRRMAAACHVTAAAAQLAFGDAKNAVAAAKACAKDASASAQSSMQTGNQLQQLQNTLKATEECNRKAAEKAAEKAAKKHSRKRPR